MTFKRTWIRGLALAGLACALGSAGPARAVDLTIGRANEQNSIDPQYSRTGNNQMTSAHVFGRLVETDANNQVHPGLAVSWKIIDPMTWELSLRPNVKWHAGSPFTAEDVAFSIQRARNVPNSPAPFAGAVGQVAGTSVVDPLTLRIRTTVPAPQLLDE